MCLTTGQDGEWDDLAGCRSLDGSESLQNFDQVRHSQPVLLIFRHLVHGGITSRASGGLSEVYPSESRKPNAISRQYERRGKTRWCRVLPSLRPPDGLNCSRRRASRDLFLGSWIGRRCRNLSINGTTTDRLWTSILRWRPGEHGSLEGPADLPDRPLQGSVDCSPT